MSESIAVNFGTHIYSLNGKTEKGYRLPAETKVGNDRFFCRTKTYTEEKGKDEGPAGRRTGGRYNSRPV